MSTLFNLNSESASASIVLAEDLQDKLGFCVHFALPVIELVRCGNKKVATRELKM